MGVRLSRTRKLLRISASSFLSFGSSSRLAPARTPSVDASSATNAGYPGGNQRTVGGQVSPGKIRPHQATRHRNEPRTLMRGGADGLPLVKGVEHTSRLSLDPFPQHVRSDEMVEPKCYRLRLW